MQDGSHDVVSAISPEPAGQQLRPPSADLRSFELSAGPAGVCARWTTAAKAPVGAHFVLVANGPAVERPSGVRIHYGHGFEVELLKAEPEVTYGLDRIGNSAPRRLRARVGQSGRTVSAFVPRAELDSAPANTPGRPPFPYRAFSFEARVMSGRETEGDLVRQAIDFWPDPRFGRAGYLRGRLCEAPCRDRALL